ncbi:MAG: DMT family transporter, partial [Fimbriimonadaceae bacterium]|nr:DMT family transporter [Alphaproteobacteria bacterium]
TFNELQALAMSYRHWFILLLTAALFGSSFFFIKLTVSTISPLTLAAARTVIGAVIIYIFMRAKGYRLPPPGKDWIILFVLGMLLAAMPYAAIAWGQVYIESSLAGILFTVIPIFTVLIGPLLLAEEYLSMQRIIGVAIGFSGVVLAIGPAALAGIGDQLLGAAATLFAALSYATGGMYTRMNRHIAPLPMAAGQLIMGSVVLVILSFVFEAPWDLRPTGAAWIGVAGVSILATAAPVLLFFWLVNRVGASNSSLLAFFVPVSAILLGVFALGESLHWQALAGLILIFVGASLVTGRARILAPDL